MHLIPANTLPLEVSLTMEQMVALERDNNVYLSYHKTGTIRPEDEKK